MLEVTLIGFTHIDLGYNHAGCERPCLSLLASLNPDLQIETMHAAAGLQARPLPNLALSMIVKNEAPTITATLNSMRDHVDYWAILDTGSTDGTQELIKQAMAGIPGELQSSPFRDFAATRNKALKMLHGKAHWVFMVDGDNTVRGTWRLQRAAARLGRACRLVSYPICGCGLQLMWDMGTMAFDSVRVWSSTGTGTKQGWHYMYPIHELATNEPVGVRQQVLYKHTTKVRMLAEIKHNKSEVRMRKFDLPLLERARQQHPLDGRIAFYYAQTLGVLKEYEAAEVAYQARVDLGGYRPETYIAMLRKAKIQKRMGKDPTEACLAADAFDPTRAEALYELADWHHEHTERKCDAWDGQCKGLHHVLAFQYAQEAAAKPREKVMDTLFVEEAVYEYKAKRLMAYHAWHAEKFLGKADGVLAAGRDAAEALAQKFPHDGRYQTLFAAFGKPMPGNSV
jgi:hypothetical protein